MSQLILTDGAPQWTIPAGSNVDILGTDGADSIALSTGATVHLSSNFNKGNDNIYIQGNAADYTVSRSGATVTLTGPDGGVVTIPVSPTAQQLIFGDGAAELKIDAGEVKIGNQVIDDTPTAIDTSAAGANIDPAAVCFRSC